MTQELDHYSAVHAMACALIGELIGRWHGWSDDDVAAPVHAALSMRGSCDFAQDDALSAPAPPPMWTAAGTR